jgi:hypothetical protein
MPRADDIQKFTEVQFQIGSDKRIIETWRTDHNQNRPYTYPNGFTPDEFAIQSNPDQKPEQAQLINDGMTER